MKKRLLLWKTLLKYTLLKQKNSMGVILIIAMVTAMMMVITGVTGSIKSSYINAMNRDGEYDYKIINMSQQVKDVIWKNLQQEKYEEYKNKSVRVDGITAYVAEPDSMYQTELCGYSGEYDKTLAWKLQEGHYPETEKEIIIDERYNKSLKVPYKIGDTISLYSQMTEKEYRFTICGFMKSTHNSNFEVCSAVTEKAMENMDAQEGVTPVYHICLSAGVKDTEKFEKKYYKLRQLVCDSTGQKDALLDKEHEDKVVIGYNEGKVEMIEESESWTGKSVFSAIDLLALFIAFASLFVIYTVLQISTDEKIRIYGMLRSIGFNRKQLVHTMFWNYFGYYLFGIVSGTALGIILLFTIGKVLLGLVEKGFPTTLDVPYEVHLTMASCVKVYCLVAMVIIISAIKIIWSVSRMKPVQAIRFYEKIPKVKIEKHAKITKKNMISFLARRSVVRNKVKSIYTFLSLFLAVVIIMAVVSCLLGKDWTDNNQFRKSALCDYEIDTDLAKKPEITPQMLKEIRGISNVDKVYPAVRNMGKYAFDWNHNGKFEKCYIKGEDTYYITIKSYPDEILNGILAENSISAKQSDRKETYYVVAGSSDNLSLAHPESLELMNTNGKKIKVAVTAYMNEDTYDEIAYPGYEIICNEAGVKKLLGEEAYNILFIRLKNSDTETIQHIQDTLLEHKVNAVYTNTDDNVADAKAQLLEILAFAFYIILCILLMSFVNIACTVKTNVNLRRYEYGMMMALGMKKNTVTKLLIAEVRHLYLYAAALAIIIVGIVGIALRDSLSGIEKIPYILVANVVILVSIWLVIVVICRNVIKHNFDDRIRNNLTE